MSYLKRVASRSAYVGKFIILKGLTVVTILPMVAIIMLATIPAVLCWPIVFILSGGNTFELVDALMDFLLELFPEKS